MIGSSGRLTVRKILYIETPQFLLSFFFPAFFSCHLLIKKQTKKPPHNKNNNKTKQKNNQQTKKPTPTTKVRWTPPHPPPNKPLLKFSLVSLSMVASTDNKLISMQISSSKVLWILWYSLVQNRKMLYYHTVMILLFGFPFPVISNLSFSFINKVKVEHLISDRFEDYVLELCFQQCKSPLSTHSSGGN